MNKTLIAVGVVIVLIGILWRPLAALPLFRLPGDLVIDRPGLKIILPLTSMIVISVVVSLLMWLFRR